MKELLTVVSLVLSGALSEAPAPYQPSGWRPSGPAFDLPTKAQTQAPQVPQYLPPVDPRNNRTPEFDSGVDVSVQGLPAQEQLPIFQVSPINGQQYVGPNFNSDIKGLENNLQQSQFQLQQEKARQFLRQQQYPANPNAANGLPNPQPPRQFVPQAAPTTTIKAKPKQAEPTTESSLKDREELEGKDALPKKAKISVEVTKLNLQEYPPELFLSSLAQLQLQQQFVPLQQFGQIREQVFLQPPQQVAPEKQVAAGYDGPTYFAALTSILAQNQLARQQQSLVPAQQAFIQNPAFIPQGQEQPASPIIVPSTYQEPVPQYQPSEYQPVAQPQLNQEPLPQYQPAVNQYQRVAQPPLAQGPLPQYQSVASQYQPQLSEPVPQYQTVLNQYQPAVQAQEPLPQYQPVDNQYQSNAQPQQYPLAIPVQPQFVNQAQPQNVETVQVDGKNEEESPQYVYQQSYQPQQVYQPQEVYQPQYAQPQFPANQYAAQPQQNIIIPQGQTINYPNQFYQNQYPQQQYAAPNQFGAEPIVQGQDGFLQSGLDVNQQGNDIDQAEEQDNSEGDDEEQDDGAKATAVATAFGARTQPRIFSQYGVPVSSPEQNNRGYQTTTESNAEDTTDVPAVAQATAVSNPSKNRSAKLRSRRPRPLFTVDRSGHLVLAREQ